MMTTILNRRDNWLYNVINYPDEVIQNMPEEDRKLFTQEGIDNLYEKYKTDLKYHGDKEHYKNWVYLKLKSKYNKYNK